MTLSEILGLPNCPEEEALKDAWVLLVKSQSTDMIRAGVFPNCADWSGWTLLERKIWRDAKEEHERSEKEELEAVEDTVNEQLKTMTDLIHDMNQTGGVIKGLGGK